VFQPSLVDTSVDRVRPVAAGADVGCMSLPHASVDVGGPRPAVVAHPGRLDVAYARTYGMTSSGIRPTLVGVPSQPGLALPSVTDVAFSHTRVRSDTPMPLSDVGQHGLARPTYDLSVPTANDVAYTLSSGNIDAIDIAYTPGPSSVDVPRPTDASVHRPMPAVGVRPPKSSVPVDVVGPSSGPAPHMCVDVVGQQRLGRPTSVDVAHYPGPPSASVDVVRPPSMGPDVVRPTPTRVDVVHLSSMGVDITRPMPVGGTHPSSMGAGVLRRPMLLTRLVRS